MYKMHTTYTDSLAFMNNFVKESLAGAEMLGEYKVHISSRFALHLLVLVKGKGAPVSERVLHISFKILFVQKIVLPVFATLKCSPSPHCAASSLPRSTLYAVHLQPPRLC